MTIWVPRFHSAARVKYLQIAEAIAEDVQSGVLKAGDHLPAQRQIAKALGVDLTTVTRALNETHKLGLTEARVGAGTVVRQDLDPSALGGRYPLLDMSMNLPPQPQQINFARLFSKSIDVLLGRQSDGAYLGYHDSQGSEPDRLAAATWLKPRLGDVALDRLVISSGAQNALSLIFDTLFQSEDVICAGTVTYPGLKALAQHRGITILPLAMDSDGILPDSLERHCRAGKLRAVYIIPTIDNPTTATLPLSRRKKIAEIARRYNLQIIEDDPYAPLCPDAPQALVSLAPERTWHIATLSKCLTPALRVAYVVAPDLALAMNLAMTLRATSLMASPLMAGVVSRWVSDGTMEKIIEGIRQESMARQTLATRILKGHGIQSNPNGHHIWLSLPSSWTSVDFVHYARRFGLAIVPAQAFSVDSNASNTVRISLGAAPNQEALEKSLILLRELLQQPSASTKAIV